MKPPSPVWRLIMEETPVFEGMFCDLMAFLTCLNPFYCIENSEEKFC
jgi:hypothetical protein